MNVQKCVRYIAGCMNEHKVPECGCFMVAIALIAGNKQKGWTAYTKDSKINIICQKCHTNTSFTVTVFLCIFLAPTDFSGPFSG